MSLIYQKVYIINVYYNDLFEIFLLKKNLFLIILLYYFYF